MRKDRILRKIMHGNGHDTTTTKIIIALLEEDKALDRNGLRSKACYNQNLLKQAIGILSKYKIIYEFKRGNHIMVTLNKKSEIVKAFRRLQKEAMKFQIIEDL